ncbi:MAG: carbohydrate deacetylase [Desulfuromonadales bacterium]
MIALVVNADDLGINTDRDRGILEAFRQGIVTSASLLANGPSFASSVEQIKETKLPVGVHLNLADGSTLTGQIEGLTDSRGQLPGKRKLRRCLVAEACDRASIRNELAAQIERLFDCGLQPDHLDSHQHCQLFPCLTTMVIELAREYGIHAMRSSLIAEPAIQDPDGPLGEELALYRQLGQDAHRKILDAGVRAPDGLWGMPLLNRLDTTSLCRLLEGLPEGCWELMTHPGYPCVQGRSFDGPQRKIELQALLSSEAQEIIARRRIRPITFGNLQCAS